MVEHTGHKRKSEAFQNLLAVIILLSLTYFVMSPVLDNELTNWDDHFYVSENTLIKDLSKENLKVIFDKQVLGNYHPITILSFAIEWHYFELNPRYYHLTNLLLHLMNTVLVFWFITLISRRFEVAFITATLFAIHPYHVESVAWISERKGLLSSFFYLGALVSYLYFIMTKKRKGLFYLLTIVLFTLGVLSKAVAVSLPIAMFAVDLFLRRKFSLKLITEKLPLIVLSVVFGLIAIESQEAAGAVQTQEMYILTDRVLFASNNFLAYLYQMVVPGELSCFYPYPVKTSGTYPMIYYLAPVICIVLAVFLFIVRKRAGEVFFGFLFYLITLALVLQLFTFGESIMADRYTYLPYIGLFLIIGYGYVYTSNSRHKLLKPLAIAVLLGFTAWLSLLSHERTKVWKDSGTLWTNVIENYPDVSLAYNNRSKVYIENEEFDLAIADYNKALELNPTNRDAYNNRGNVYRGQGKGDLALADYNMAIKLDPGFAIAYSNRSFVYYDKQEFDKALEDALKTMSLGMPMKKEYIEWLQARVGQ